MHKTHETRFSDSSLYDEVCVNCGVTDAQNSSVRPCPELSPRGKTGSVTKTDLEGSK